MDFEGERLCDSCEENEGCVLCSTCNAWLCEECDKSTHELPGFSAHKRQDDCQAPGFCCNHHTRAMALCEDCKKLCCRRCMTDPQHRGHRFVECAAASVAYSKKKMELVAMLEDAQALGQNATAGIQAEIDALSECRQGALDAIEAAFGRIADALEARKEKLIDMVAERADAEEARLQNVYNDLDAKCANADQSLEDFRAQEEAASEDGKDNSSGGALIALSADMERLISEITADIKKTLNEATAKSIAIKFAEEQEGGTGKDKPSGDKSVDSIVENFGRVGFDPKYDAKRMLSIKTEEGKPDIDDTSVGLTWESAPVPVLSLAQQCEAFVFTVEQRDPQGKEFREVWTGREIATRCTGLQRGKRSEFRVRGCLRGTGAERAIWTSNTLGVIGGGFPGRWKEGPNTKFYDEEHTIAGRIEKDYTTIIGSEVIPKRCVTKWRIKVVETKDGDNGMMIGVAPADVDRREGKDNSEECGWYFSLYRRNLFSGPPQNERSGNYADCDRINAGDIVTVTMDTTGELGVLSFMVNEKDLGPAYKDIPLDKDLVPALFLYKTEEKAQLLPL